MGRGTAPEPADLVEVGTEPEFVITHIAKFEPLQSGWVRLFLAAHRSKKMDRIEFTVVCSAEDLARMGRHALDIASTAHNMSAMIDPALKPN